MIPFLLAAILFSYFGLQRRACSRARGIEARPAMNANATTPMKEDTQAQGMSYLESLRAAW